MSDELLADLSVSTVYDMHVLPTRVAVLDDDGVTVAVADWKELDRDPHHVPHGEPPQALPAASQIPATIATYGKEGATAKMDDPANPVPSSRRRPSS